jgi:hypothetical protein
MKDNYFKVKKGLIVYGDNGLLFNAGSNNIIKIGGEGNETIISDGLNLRLNQITEEENNTRLLSIDTNNKVSFTNISPVGYSNDYGDLDNKPSIKEKIITVSLEDIGASNFEDDVSTKIKTYAISNNITRELNTLHKWNIVAFYNDVDNDSPNKMTIESIELTQPITDTTPPNKMIIETIQLT